MLRLFKCLLGPALSALAFAPLAAAQTPQPTQQSTQTAPAQQPSNPAVTTLHSGAQLVVVDVVVTDKNHKPVHGLKEADFALVEGSVPQVIKHFEEHTALTPAEATKFQPLPKLPPGIFTNYSPESVNGAVTLLLLDSLNTPMQAQAYLRQQLLDYLSSSPPGARIAIFGLTSHLIILQGFTSDPALLKAVLTTKLAKLSPLLQDSVGGGGIQNSVADDLEDIGAQAETVANARLFEAEQQSIKLQLRTKYTLDAMNQIARYLSSIPGRKNLIWFSGSFPISILPDISGTLADPFAVMADSENEFRDTVNLLSRSQVAVYPIDVRGLVTSPVFDAATDRNYARNTARLTQDQNKFSSDNAQEHDTMRAMADATGGHAFVNTNDLTQAVASAIAEGSNFYTLTYTPANSDRKGEFRKIKIQLAREGLNLSYRHGYYADDPTKGPAISNGQSLQSTFTDAAVTAADAPDSRRAMRVAMTRGSPTPTEILMKVSVYPIGPLNQTEDVLAPGNTSTATTHGPFHRYSVSYAIDPSDITFLRSADGKINANFELLIFVFNPEGVIVNSLGTGVHITSTLDEISKKVAHGIHYSQEISAPAKGEYFFRIGVHDLYRDRYGVVEVATSEVKNLSPLPVTPVPPPASAPAAGPTPSAPR